MSTSTLRRQSREVALQVLFQMETQGLTDLRSAINLYRETFSATPEVWVYAEQLLKGVINHRVDIDKAISDHSAHWKIERMPSVDVALLRIATYELLQASDDVPPAAAINEAIELSKRFSTAESGKFINGVLDQIRKSAGRS